MTSAVADFHGGMSLPFVLERQLANLGVQRLDVRSVLPFLAGGREHLGRTPQQLGLPLRDLVRVDIEPLGQLHQRVVALDGGQCHLRLEHG